MVFAFVYLMGAYLLDHNTDFISPVCAALGTLGAVVITSLIWPLMHQQYGWFDVMTIFFAGIILGTARAWTESILVPLALHAWMNLIATVEVAIYVQRQ